MLLWAVPRAGREPPPWFGGCTCPPQSLCLLWTQSAEAQGRNNCTEKQPVTSGQLEHGACSLGSRGGALAHLLQPCQHSQVSENSRPTFPYPVPAQGAQPLLS